MTDDERARALAQSLFGTDDTELMTVQQLLDYKALQAVLREARAEGLEEARQIVLDWHGHSALPAAEFEERYGTMELHEAIHHQAGREEGDTMNTVHIQICDEILAIMTTYHEQEATPDGVGTPGGLEHMGDVWTLFRRWEGLLKGHP